MAITARTDLDGHPLRDIIIQRLETHPDYRTFCFHTLAELQEISQHQTKNWMRWGESVHWQWRSRWTETELAVMNDMQRVIRQEDIEQQEERVKVAIEKTARYIQDITTVVEHEEELREQFYELRNTTFGLGQSLIEERVAD